MEARADESWSPTLEVSLELEPVMDWNESLSFSSSLGQGRFRSAHMHDQNLRGQEETGEC